MRSFPDKLDSSKPFLAYGKQWVDEEDIQSVVEVLRSDWLTTGPAVEAFERGVCEQVGAIHGIALSSGTAALHGTMCALGVGPGDEVIVPSMTFAATANAVVYRGAAPVFADVRPDTLLIDAADVEKKITPKTKAILAVDYAGQPCDYVALRRLAAANNLALVSDACHSIGGSTAEGKVGVLADLTAFSFHPVKHITTGEGGMVVTGDPELAARVRTFRNHGITSDHRQRAVSGSWFYEMVDLGYNYRLSDIHCALGLSQLKKLASWVARRQEIADQYAKFFRDVEWMAPLSVRAGVSHAYHLYVVRLDLERVGMTRGEIFTLFRNSGIGVNVHYIPVHLHPYYRRTFGTHDGMLPVTEASYQQIVSLPMFPRMSSDEVSRVIDCVKKIETHERIPAGK